MSKYSDSGVEYSDSGFNTTPLEETTAALGLNSNQSRGDDSFESHIVHVTGMEAMGRRETELANPEVFDAYLEYFVANAGPEDNLLENGKEKLAGIASEALEEAKKIAAESPIDQAYEVDSPEGALASRGEMSPDLGGRGGGTL